MTEIVYRQLDTEDAQKYRQLRLDCLKNHPHNFGSTYKEELGAGSSRFEKILLANDGNDFLMGAFLNETLIGICGFIQMNRNKTKHQGEIMQMYVDPVYTGKGIGIRLLTSAIDKAFANEQIEQILLGVVYSNEHAVSIYKKTGFVQYGKLDNYFKDGDQQWSQLFMVLTRLSYIDHFNEPSL